MLKAQRISDLADGQTGRRQFFFGLRDQFFMDMLLRIPPGMDPKQVAQVVRRQIHLRSQILHGKQTSYLSHKIFVHDLFEFDQQVGIVVLTCYELSFIKAFGIIKQ